MDIKAYKKGCGYSYTLGAFPTFEMLYAAPQCIIEIVAHSSFTDMDKLQRECAERKIKVTVNDKLVNKLSDKENVFVVGIFEPFYRELNADKPHLVLVSPSNMGNLGTIIRTAVGFNIKELAIISPAADIFNPKTVRASMGSIFRMNFRYYDSFDDYRTEFPKHEVFTFMLNGKRPLTVSDCPKPELFALVFGNEATGLPSEFLEKGTSIIIPQTEDVDSLNLTIAAGIGMYMFTH